MTQPPRPIRPTDPPTHDDLLTLLARQFAGTVVAELLPYLRAAAAPPPVPPAPTWLSVQEAAEAAKISPSAIRAACASGRLRHVRHGRALRISAEAFDHWIAARTRGGSA